MEKLLPLSYTHNINDVHSGGFSLEEEGVLGLKEYELAQKVETLHELVTLHKKNFSINLERYKEIFIKKNPLYKEIGTDVFIHQDTHIHESVVFDSSGGPIIIEGGVKISPFCFIVGPMRICDGTIINPHSYIKGSYLGKNCRVGGEVGDSVIESYSNKAHYGCLEDSYVGSWVNIGGGSSTSNLKNTYGIIKMGGIDTGEQFLGSIISDYVKIAANTTIYTGKIIGVASHIYGTVTTDVPSFVNYISKDKMIVLPIDIVVKIAERMSKRRGVEITEESKKMLSYAYDQTENERRGAGVRSEKLEF